MSAIASITSPATSPATPAATATATATSPTSDPTSKELIEANLPLVGYIVREFAARIPAHVNRDDLVSAGMFALVNSANGFQAARGVPFAHFASVRIRGALIDHLRTLDWASRAVRGRSREVDTATATLAAQLGRSPSREEVANAIGVPVSVIAANEADVARASVLSLEGLAIDAQGAAVPAHEDGPEALLMRREQIGFLLDAIAELPSRLRLVVEQFFFAQRKMADIAAELGVTESRVSQLRARALEYLREGMAAYEAGEQAGEQAAPQPRQEAKPVRRSAASRQAYCAAANSRSSLSARLTATTALGEVRSTVGLAQNA